MFGFFKRADPFVQGLSGWATLCGILLTGFYGVIGFLSPLFSGLHWTAKVLMAIGLSLATLLALAVVAAIGAWTYRTFRPVPANEIAQELERTKERLKRAEERLDGATVVSAVGHAGGKAKSAAAAPERPVDGPILSPPQQPPKEEQPPLNERERGFCRAALIEVRNFLTGDLTTLHHGLAQTQKPENQSQLTPKMSTFQIQAAQAHEGSRRLQEKHWTWLHRMADNLDLKPLQEALAELQRKLSAVKQGIDHGFPAQALMECLKPMYSQNREVGRLGKGLIEGIDAAEAEFFGD